MNLEVNIDKLKSAVQHDFVIITDQYNINFEFNGVKFSFHLFGENYPLIIIDRVNKILDYCIILNDIYKSQYVIDNDDDLIVIHFIMKNCLYELRFNVYSNYYEIYENNKFIINIRLDNF